MDKKNNFLRTAISDKKVAAIAPSSGHLVKKALEPIAGKTLRTVIEYGPGDGIMTREILRRLRNDGRLIAIETNDEFVRHLRDLKDPRLEVMHGEIQKVVPKLRKRGLRDVDLIIGSVPFSWIAPKDRDMILKHSVRLLADEGRLIFFHQYVPVIALTMRKYFPKIRLSFVLRNVFPCFIVSAENIPKGNGPDGRRNPSATSADA